MKPNTRVRVLSGDCETKLGEGVFVGDVPLFFFRSMDGSSLESESNPEERPSDELIQHMKGRGFYLESTDRNPKIVLDTGKVVYGCQVWWEPVEHQVIDHQPIDPEKAARMKELWEETKNDLALCEQEAPITTEFIVGIPGSLKAATIFQEIVVLIRSKNSALTTLEKERAEYKESKERQRDLIQDQVKQIEEYQCATHYWRGLARRFYDIMKTVFDAKFAPWFFSKTQIETLTQLVNESREHGLDEAEV